MRKLWRERRVEPGLATCEGLPCAGAAAERLLPLLTALGAGRLRHPLAAPARHSRTIYPSAHSADPEIVVLNTCGVCPRRRALE